jgi:hypothetical protein
MRLCGTTTGGWAWRCAAACAVLLASFPAGAAGDFFVAGVVPRDGVSAAEARQVTRALRATLTRQGLQAEAKGSDNVSPANAAKELKAVEALLKEARNSFDELDQKACISAVQEALDRYDQAPAYYGSSSSMANGLLLMAMALEKSGQKARARPVYTLMVARFPDHQPDPSVFPPSVMEAVRKARAEVDGAAGLTFTVDSTPAGAHVFIDGTERGNTPLPWRLGKGKHALRLETDDGTVKTLAINVGEGPPKVTVTLEHPAEKAVQKLLASLQETKPEAAAQKAAVGVGARSGAAGVLVGSLWPAPSGSGHLLALARFDAPAGDISRALKVDLPEEGNADTLLKDAVRQLCAAQDEGDAAELKEGRGLVLGTVKPPKPSRAPGKATTRPSDGENAVGTPAAEDKPRGLGVPLLALLGLGIIPIAAVVFAVALGVASAALGGGLYLFLYPPNPYGTTAKVDGRKLQ